MVYTECCCFLIKNQVVFQPVYDLKTANYYGSAPLIPGIASFCSLAFFQIKAQNINIDYSLPACHIFTTLFCGMACTKRDSPSPLCSPKLSPAGSPAE